MEAIWYHKLLVHVWSIEIFWLLGTLSYSIYELITVIDSPTSPYAFTATTSVALILNAVSIGLYVKHRLEPVFYLLTAITKFLSTLILSILVLSLYDYFSLLYLAFSVPLTILGFGQIGYGGVVLHRARKNRSSRIDLAYDVHNYHDPPPEYKLHSMMSDSTADFNSSYGDRSSFQPSTASGDYEEPQAAVEATEPKRFDKNN